jgi:hypothetical protein
MQLGLTQRPATPISTPEVRRGEERTIAISSGAFFIFARRFDGGMPGMRDGVLGLELVVNYSYSSSSPLTGVSAKRRRRSRNRNSEYTF